MLMSIWIMSLPRGNRISLDNKDGGDQPESLNQSLVMISQFKAAWVSCLPMASGHD